MNWLILVGAISALAFILVWFALALGKQADERAGFDREPDE